MDGDKIEPVEWDVMENPFTELFPIKLQGGLAVVPDGIGIGVEPDWRIINALRWDGSAYV